MADFDEVEETLAELVRFLDVSVPKIIGVDAVNFYKKSFVDQGFTDKRLEKWQEVKRRVPDSPWYGFKYRSTAKNPNKASKDGAITNYAPVATKREILSGETQELMNSIRWQKKGFGVTITAGVPYAQIHNEGGKMKVFGKTPAEMPKRQFMGPSKVLEDQLKYKILKRINEILTK